MGERPARRSPALPEFQSAREENGEVPVSRRRGGLAAARGDWQPAERSFFCRSCQMAERGLWVPAGWYLLERAPGGQGRHLRLGLYCSLECLMQAAGTLREGAAEHAQRLGLGSEEEHVRARARIVETAQTLLHGGMTIRQAADNLNVPTSALRTWLSAAGIRVGAGAGDGQATYIGGSDPATNPVGRVNELAQRCLLTDVKWRTRRSGPEHEPCFTATVTAQRDGRAVTGTGSAATKATAKADAARALLTDASL